MTVSFAGAPGVQSLESPSVLPTACFAVHARATPGALPRILETFAKRGWIPSSVEARLVSGGEELAADIQMPGLDRDTAMLVAANLRSIVDVQSVLTTQRIRSREG